MKILTVIIVCTFLIGCAAQKEYVMSPELCPEPVEVYLPKPPAAVTAQPAATNFLERLTDYFEEAQQ